MKKAEKYHHPKHLEKHKQVFTLDQAQGPERHELDLHMLTAMPNMVEQGCAGKSCNETRVILQSLQDSPVRGKNSNNCRITLR